MSKHNYQFGADWVKLAGQEKIPWYMQTYYLQWKLQPTQNESKVSEFDEYIQETLDFHPERPLGVDPGEFGGTTIDAVADFTPFYGVLWQLGRSGSYAVQGKYDLAIEHAWDAARDAAFDVVGKVVKFLYQPSKAMSKEQEHLYFGDEAATKKALDAKYDIRSVEQAGEVIRDAGRPIFGLGKAFDLYETDLEAFHYYSQTWTADERALFNAELDATAAELAVEERAEAAAETGERAAEREAAADAKAQQEAAERQAVADAKAQQEAAERQAVADAKADENAILKEDAEAVARGENYVDDLVGRLILNGPVNVDPNYQKAPAVVVPLTVVNRVEYDDPVNWAEYGDPVQTPTTNHVGVLTVLLALASGAIILNN